MSCIEFHLLYTITQFEDAEDLIKLTKGFFGETGPIHLEPAMRGQQWGDMSLHCAELLNKWAGVCSCAQYLL